MQRLRVYIAAACLAAPSVAFAQQAAIPDACTPLATVQKNGCAVSTIFDCGSTKVTHSYAGGQFAAVHTYSPEWEFVSYQYANPKLPRMNHVSDSGRTTNMSELLETGTSQAGGTFHLNTNIIKDRKYVLTGRNELTGEVELGGRTFKSGRMYRVFEREPGKGGLEFEIDIYVTEDMSVFIEGTLQRSIMGNNLEEFDETPQSVAWPGDDGFLSTVPEHGCE